MLTIPAKPAHLLDILQKNGYSAYIVGGCVRDALLGIEPHDWDMCTSALPEEIVACFPEYEHIDNGIKHGTVGIVLDKEVFEITTFRAEGKYTDHRHPDEVRFNVSLGDDLARRDFTINAMAYNERDGLVDLFDGKNDLKRGIIRCVGEPERRFEEDALRILRALRFAGRFGFEIDKSTAKAMTDKCVLLADLPAERILSELQEIFTCKTAGDILTEYNKVLNAVMPVADADYYQIDSLPADFSLRLAAVLCMQSEMCIDRVLADLKVPNKTKVQVQGFADYFENGVTVSKYDARKLISTYGAELAAKIPWMHVVKDDKQSFETANSIMQQVIASEKCFKISDLKINGRDLIQLGVEGGPKTGIILSELLEDVLTERICNDRAVLLSAAESKINAGE